VTLTCLQKIVMAGLVPAIQTRGRSRMDRGGDASQRHQTSVLLDGRDKPGHDETSEWAE